jgi:hypothetical protein
MTTVIANLNYNNLTEWNSAQIFHVASSASGTYHRKTVVMKLKILLLIVLHLLQRQSRLNIVLLLLHHFTV